MFVHLPLPGLTAPFLPFPAGCIFAELLTGSPLFPGKTNHDQLWLVLKALKGRMTDQQRVLLDEDPQFECFRLPMLHEFEPLERRYTGDMKWRF